MRNTLIALTLVFLAPTASAQVPADVMAPIRQFIDGFNKGDVPSALAACADQAFVIDEIPPYEWTGAGDTARALELVERAVDNGFYPYDFLAVHCRFMAPLRGRPAFDRILAKARRRVAEFSA